MPAKKKPAPTPREGFLNREAFLRSQGPPVVEIVLPMMGLTALMRRVDLFAMAKSGIWPTPITNMLLKSIRKGGVDDEMLDETNLTDTLDTAAAITKMAIVVPPPEYLEGKIELADIDADSLKPFFVDSDPDEDQVILDWVTPDEDASDEVDTEAEMAHGRLHWRDVAQVLTFAYMYGPGGLGKIFRES